MKPSPTIIPDQLRLSVAPMMDWTDSHCRVFHRLLAPNARLYSEMVHANAVMLGDRARLLAMDPCEHPVALQLGGSEPALLAQAARTDGQTVHDQLLGRGRCSHRTHATARTSRRSVRSRVCGSHPTEANASGVKPSAMLASLDQTSV